MTLLDAGARIVAAPAALADPVTVPAADLRSLWAGLRGRVLTAGDEGYDAARRGHNLVFDRHPAVVVRPADVTDVSRAVLTARDSVSKGVRQLHRSSTRSEDRGVMLNACPTLPRRASSPRAR